MADSEITTAGLFWPGPVRRVTLPNEISCQDAIPALHMLVRGKCLNPRFNLESVVKSAEEHRGPSLEYDGRADLGVRFSILSICI